MGTSYLNWLKREGVPVFETGGVSWRLYNNALIPASVGPCYVTLSAHEGEHLLRSSGAWVLRYSSDPGTTPTEWWYVVCDQFDAGKLSSKARNQIKRGKRNCSVSRVDAHWLAEHGYDCYLAAYARYTQACPVSKESFRNRLLRTVGGPVEHWGVFVGAALAAYAQCLVDEENVETSVIKFDPAYLKEYSSYALVSSLIDHYAVREGRMISNGNRSIAHDTSFQEFLIKLGFRKQYCRLTVLYRSWLGLALHAAYPFRRFVAGLPHTGNLTYKLRSLLHQEELQRRCRASDEQSSPGTLSLTP